MTSTSTTRPMRVELSTATSVHCWGCDWKWVWMLSGSGECAKLRILRIPRFLLVKITLNSSIYVFFAYLWASIFVSTPLLILFIPHIRSNAGFQINTGKAIWLRLVTTINCNFYIAEGSSRRDQIRWCFNEDARPFSHPSLWCHADSVHDFIMHLCALHIFCSWCYSLCTPYGQKLLAYTFFTADSDQINYPFSENSINQKHKAHPMRCDVDAQNVDAKWVRRLARYRVMHSRFNSILIVNCLLFAVHVACVRARTACVPTIAACQSVQSPFASLPPGRASV